MNPSEYQLERLPVSAPPVLCEAVGYPGRARFVAFYWTPDSDEMMFTDGHISADGNWYAWLTFVQHPEVAVHLDPYDFGSSDNEAKHWLLIDRETNEIYAGMPKEVCRMLVQQIPEHPAYEQREETPGADDVKALDASLWKEVETPNQEEIKSEMRRRNLLLEELVRQLDNSRS
jgi:hypothetical protein